jgi:hypothetical protein
MSATIIYVTFPDSLRPYQSRIQYVFDFVSTHPCANGLSLVVQQPTEGAFFTLHYGGLPTTSDGLYVPCDEAIIRASPQQQPAYFAVANRWEQETVYGVSSTAQPAMADFFAQKRFGFDWISTLFFHLSRIEEYASATVDDIGLMPSAQLWSVRNGLEKIPVADRLVCALSKVLTGAYREVPTEVWTSHDLDTLRVFGEGFRLLRYLGGTALRYRKIDFWPKIIADYAKVKWGGQKDPADNFDVLLRLKTNGPKTLYFGAGRHRPQDIFPPLCSARMLEIRWLAREMGYQFGFHPGFSTWKNAEIWQQEWREASLFAGAPLLHSRQHYLRFAFPETADILEKTGIKTDSSLGFRDNFGFRCGTGFSFHLYHFAEERPYFWTEEPLILMDIGLLRAGGYQLRTVTEQLSGFIAQNTHNTRLFLNFHNSYFYEPERAGLPLLRWYSQLLQKEVKLLRD